MARLMGGDQKVVVSYDRSAAGSQALEDSDNQEVGDFTTGSDGVPAVDNKSTLDRTPPALTAATVSTNGNNVTLTFDENVVPAVGVLPSALADAFTVTVDGVDRGVTRVASLARTQVTLSVASTIHQGQTVTVGYDFLAAGTNALLDDANNDVVPFTTGENSVPPVTNNSTVASAKLASCDGACENGRSVILTFDKALNAVPTGEVTANSESVHDHGGRGPGAHYRLRRSLNIRRRTTSRSWSAPRPRIYKDDEVVLTYEKPTGGDGLTDQADDQSVASFTTGALRRAGGDERLHGGRPAEARHGGGADRGQRNLSRVQLGPRRSGDRRAGAEGRLHGDRRQRGAGVRRPGVLRPRGHVREARLHRDADPGGGEP